MVAKLRLLLLLSDMLSLDDFEGRDTFVRDIDKPPKDKPPKPPQERF